MADERTPPLLRALDDREIRLNCLALACHATTYMRGRMTDPITIAEEFFDWITSGAKPAPAKVQFGTQRVPEAVEGFASGLEPSNAEAMRASTGGADLIDVGASPRRRPS